MLARLTTALRAIAMLALVVMMLVTTLDITMRLAINELVLGSVEIVQLTIVAVVFCAIPESFLRGRHIAVDAIDQFVSRAAQRRLRFAGALLTLVLLSVMAAWMFPIALDTLEVGDSTTDLGVSLFWYWLPILVGTVAAALVMVLVTVEAYRAFQSPEGAAESSPNAF